MRFPARRLPVDGAPGVSGTIRMDRRIGSLVRRLRPGDVAVIDHLDLDRASAEALVGCGVVAVVNASQFVSGRYPNLGPEVLARSGVVMIDDVGSEVFAELSDGSTVRLHQGCVLVADREVVRGRELGAKEVSALTQEARNGLSTQLQSFTHNTTEFLRREQDLLLHGRGLPALQTRLAGRPVVVVVPGYDHRDDLRRLRRFIREQHPVLVGVDGGADALLSAGHRPDVVVVGAAGLDPAPSASAPGTPVSDKALRGAREVVLHADRSGRADSGERLERLGLRHHTITASGTSEDVALLLADRQGAGLIIAVGAPETLEEFLDRQRSGMASSFLTQLRVGANLIGAKQVPQLYAGRVRLWHLVAVLLAGLVALVAAVAATPVGGLWWSSSTSALSDVLAWTQGLLS